jgi:hypothetical protein
MKRAHGKCLVRLTASVLFIVSVLLPKMVDAWNIPNSYTDLWDVSQGITILNSSPATTPYRPIENMFGQKQIESPTITWELTLFDSNGGDQGVTDFVEWSTANPIILTGFNLFSSKDTGSTNRIIDKVSLFYWDEGSWQVFYQRYVRDLYGSGDNLELNVTNAEFISPVYGRQKFRAEFVHVGDGPRIHELDGYGVVLAEGSSPALPAIDIPSVGLGVADWNGLNGSNIEFYVRVVDQDGVDPNSHSVTVTFPGTLEPLGTTSALVRYYSQDGPYAAIYDTGLFLGKNFSIPNGQYVFRVTDRDGNVGTATESFSFNPLPIIPDSSLSLSLWGQATSAIFDDVYVKRSGGDFVLYDNFTNGLNNSLWRGSGGGTASFSGSAQFTIQEVYQTTFSQLLLLDRPDEVTGIKSSLKLLSASAAAVSQIGGYFFKIDTRNVIAKIQAAADRITYVTAIESQTGTSTLQEGTLAEGDFVGSELKLSIDWNAGEKSLSFEAVVDGTSYPKMLSFSTENTAAPTKHDKYIETRMQLVTEDTCPTISWAAVPGAGRYRVRYYQNNGGTVVYTANFSSEQTSYKTPPGILNPNTLYQYRVDAYDNHMQLDFDNATKAPSFGTMNFMTGSKVVYSPYIELETNGVQTWTDPEDGTYLNFYIRVHDADGVPENIQRVKVIMPNGIEKILVYDPASSGSRNTTAIYQGEHHGVILPGTYRFHVEDWDGNAYETQETLSDNPIPAVTNVQPANGSVLDNTELQVSWDPVPGAVLYKVNIDNLNWSTAYTFSTEGTRYSLPAGILREDTMYRLRVIARREYNDQNLDNSSHNGRTSYGNNFLTTPITTDPPYANQPSITSDRSGVYVIKYPGMRDSNPLYHLSFWALVTDLDGVPANIASVKVKYPPPDNRELLLLYEHAVGPTGAIYWHREPYNDPALIPQGTYTFTVTDYDGNTSSFTDTLIVNPLALPSNLSPTNGEYVKNTTPTIKWDEVPEASFYRIFIYKGFDANAEEPYKSDYITINRYTVPAGVLKEGGSYNYRVSAYREDPAIDLDNMSSSPIRTSERLQFTVVKPNTDSDGDGISAAIDTLPDISSYDFDDGQTSGTILDRGDPKLKLRISDEAYPAGVLIETALEGSGNPATVSVCGGAGVFTLTAGDRIQVTCGSVTIKVLNGVVAAEFKSSDGVLATADLDTNQGLSFDPDKFAFTAPSTNTSVVAVFINNEVIPVGIGSTKKIVGVDIRPDNFNSNDAGVLPVAILGSETLDVTLIYPPSLMLQGLTVKVTGKKDPRHSIQFADVNGDGILDALVKFEDNGKWIPVGGDHALLTGRLTNGLEIEGMDIVKVKNKP